MRYPIRMFWSEQDEGYICTVPDLPGCCAWGATREDAAEEIGDAISAWCNAASRMGIELPTPSVWTE